MENWHESKWNVPLRSYEKIKDAIALSDIRHCAPQLLIYQISKSTRYLFVMKIPHHLIEEEY